MHSSFHTTSRPGSGEAKLANSYPPQIVNTKGNIDYSFPIFEELKSPAATNLKYKLNVRVAFSSNCPKVSDGGIVACKELLSEQGEPPKKNLIWDTIKKSVFLHLWLFQA